MVTLEERAINLSLIDSFHEKALLCCVITPAAISRKVAAEARGELRKVRTIFMPLHLTSPIRSRKITTNAVSLYNFFLSTVSSQYYGFCELETLPDPENQLESSNFTKENESSQR
jgi:hypothetical protein